MTSIREAVRRIIFPATPLAAGTYSYKSPPESPQNYRLHLRLESDGTGVLIVNAQTVLHLNQTAAEYTYHLIQNTPAEIVARQFASRYKVKPHQAMQDFSSLRERIDTLIHTPDLDPEIYLDFERTTPYGRKLSAPLRLDCALTYILPTGINPDFAPTKRVSKELNTEEWFKVVDKAWTVGIPHILFTGGEPILRPDLPDLIRRAEENGQVTGLLTSGYRLGDPDFMKELLLTGLDHVLFVLYPENEDCWKILDALLAEDIFVAVHLTINELNLSHIHNWIQRLSKQNAKALSLSAAHQDLRDNLYHARNFASELGLSMVWDLPVPYGATHPVAIETEEDSPPPGAGHAWLYLEPDGDVLAGQGFPEVLGNFLTDPWEKLWHHKD